MGSVEAASISDVSSHEDTLNATSTEVEVLALSNKILCLVGTRPEVIKMAPVIQSLKHECWAEVEVLATAQHRQLLDEALGYFKIKPDFDLNIMRPNQALVALTSRLLLDLDGVFQSEKPEAVLMQGDTTTVMSASLACFYRRIPFGHLEAGLRTWDIHNPFPEEANRTIVSRLARWHFAPTVGSRGNLLKEGIRDEDIFVTGNTVIDALLRTIRRDFHHGIELDPAKRTILVTCHRRESFGKPFRDICRALFAIAKKQSGCTDFVSCTPKSKCQGLRK